MKKFIVKRLKNYIAKNIHLKHQFITNSKGKLSIFVWVELFKWDIRKKIKVELSTGKILELKN